MPGNRGGECSGLPTAGAPGSLEAFGGIRVSAAERTSGTATGIRPLTWSAQHPPSVAHAPGVYPSAVSEAPASRTTFMPPVTLLSGWRITLSRDDGVFGSVKSWVTPKPMS